MHSTHHIRQVSPLKGFTLIELLVVISIIGLLSSIIIAALSTAREKAYDAKRFSDLNQVNIALQTYYDDNIAYPSTSAQWYSLCGYGFMAAHQQSSANAVVPGLAPNYLAVVPTGPQMNSSNGGQDCYAYKSNGTDFKFADFYPQNAGGETPAAVSSLYDSSGAGADWAVWSPGGANF